MAGEWIRNLSEGSFLKRIEALPPGARNAALHCRMAHDPEFFARSHFPHHCRLPFAGFHRLLFRWHTEMGGALPGRLGRRYALAAPRGCAKSTIASLILPIHDLVYQRERYIVLLSATERQARGRLRAMRGEIERGPVAALLRGRPLKCSATVLTSGSFRMDAHGAGSEIRGVSHEGFRPTKIILDDADPSAAAHSPRTRERLAEWFSSIVEHLGDGYTHIIAVGTILHGGALLPRLLGRADFRGHVQKSIESFATDTAAWEPWRRLLLDYTDPGRRETARRYFLANSARLLRGTAVAWPEKEDYEALLAQLTLQGRHAFYQEKQNTPLGPEDALFDSAAALRARWNGDSLEVHTAGERETLIRTHPGARAAARRFGWLDAAMGKHARRGDFAALAAVLLLPDGTLVAESLRAGRHAPTRQVALLFDQHDAAPFERLAIEGTGFQELLLLPIEEEKQRRRRAGRAWNLPVETAHPTRSKAARIATLEPLLASGRLVLFPTLDEEFWEELATYPRSAHDDALDALAGAVGLALGGATKDGALIHGASQQRKRGGY